MAQGMSSGPFNSNGGESEDCGLAWSMGAFLLAGQFERFRLLEQLMLVCAQALVNAWRYSWPVRPAVKERVRNASTA
jgi:hypothetical protein